MGSTEQHYSLRWNDYTVKIVTAFQSLRDEEDFVDVTVACDGHHYSAHKMVLSACSPYFRSLLRANPCQHPIVILKDVGHIEMERLLEFMYNGEVNIAQDQLAAFLKTAENLKIRGLAGSSEDMEQSQSKDNIHTYTNSNTANNTSGPASGKTSPSVFGSSMVAKEEDGNLDSSVTYQNRIESPPSKRRKRTNTPATSHTDSNATSHTPDGILTDGVDLEGSGVSGGSMNMEEDMRMIDRREMKPEPTDPLSEVYNEATELGGDSQHQQDQMDQRPVMYPIGIAGPSGTGVGSQENLSSQEPGDVSALMAITNTVQGTAVTEQPIKCPLCMAIIKQARNLRRHVLKRHLPAAQRGEITEADVKRVLEQKLKNITVTPLTDEELLQVQQRTRRKGVKTPRKKKGIAALPATVNSSAINETEITIRKLPQKKDKKTEKTDDSGYVYSSLQIVPSSIINTNDESASSREDILRGALLKDRQEGVMDLATNQHQLPPISVVVSHGDHSAIEGDPQPMSLTVTQTASGVHARIPAEAALQAGMRLETESGSPLALNRDMTTLSFEPQSSLNESIVTYQASTSQSISQPSTTTTSVSGYIPVSYWTAAQGMGLPSGTFQPHQTVFAPTPSEYFTSGAHMNRPAAFDKMPQHRRKPY